MSLPRFGASLAKSASLAGLFLAAAIMSACTVRPLYSSATPPGAPSTSTELSQISIKPMNERVAQEVRNHLIFMFGGGSGQPAAQRYLLDLGVTLLDETTLLVQEAREDRPSAGLITLTSDYYVTDTETGARVAQGRQHISVSYDQPQQEFARIRARRDAENRAARELAELLRLSIAQQFSRTSG